MLFYLYPYLFAPYLFAVLLLVLLFAAEFLLFREGRDPEKRMGRGRRLAVRIFSTFGGIAALLSWVLICVKVFGSGGVFLWNGLFATDLFVPLGGGGALFLLTAWVIRAVPGIRGRYAGLKRTIASIAFVVPLLAILGLTWIGMTFRADTTVHEIPSEDGQHTVVVIRQLFLTAESLAVFERENPFWIRRMQQDGGKLNFRNGGPYRVEWLEDGFLFDNGPGNEPTHFYWDE